MLKHLGTEAAFVCIARKRIPTNELPIKSVFPLTSKVIEVLYSNTQRTV